MDNIFNSNEITIRDQYKRASYLLTPAEISALQHDIPMTQELYNSIIDKIMHMIPSANELLFYILQDSQYDAFMISYAENHLE